MHTRYVIVTIGNDEPVELFMNNPTKGLIYRALLDGKRVTIQYDHGFVRTLYSDTQVIW